MKVHWWLVFLTVAVLWLGGSFLGVFLNGQAGVNKTTIFPPKRTKPLKEYVPPPQKPIYQPLPERKSDIESNIQPLPEEDFLESRSNYQPLKEEK